MTLHELLNDLTRRGIVVSVDGDRLNIDAPRCVMTPDLMDRLRCHKADLLDLQRNPQPKAIYDVAAIWLSALDQLDGDPSFPVDILADMRAADVRWAFELPESDRTESPRINAKPA